MDSFAKLLKQQFSDGLCFVVCGKRIPLNQTHCDVHMYNDNRPVCAGYLPDKSRTLGAAHLLTLNFRESRRCSLAGVALLELLRFSFCVPIGSFDRKRVGLLAEIFPFCALFQYPPFSIYSMITTSLILAVEYLLRNFPNRRSCILTRL